MKRIYYFCLQLSAIAFAVSAIAHVASFFGDGIMLKGIAIALFFGLVLFAPFVWAADWAVRRRLGIRLLGFHWASTLWAGCPKAMRTGTLVIMLYYVLCFGGLAIASLWFPGFEKSDYWNDRILCWLGSAFGMGVYSQFSTAFYAVLYTHDQTRECPNGHPVFPWSKKCGECGRALLKTSPMAGPQQ